ncbi:hypothetical protein [Peribacillus frigoritolerans]|uniref:hypothetical protein n=1 Tax=Peribacillus frigoritolerans TaxID=450367 RepID=UPI00105A2E4A|nr:hypothetical protein [Peribacillus frigoritolerans]TDL76148.1 hypothetical protein E2R53_20850 [Peribacillus frigoritolerans]
MDIVILYSLLLFKIVSREGRKFGRTKLKKDGSSLNTIVQAIIGSVILHLIYYIITFTIGYIKTKRYIPDIGRAWENANNLPNEVEFERKASPAIFIGSFIGVTLICGLIIFTLKISFI